MTFRPDGGRIAFAVGKPADHFGRKRIFYALAALTVGSALMVAFSRNIVYSTFALLGAFIAYQLYRLYYHLTIGLTLLTIFDAFIVWLTWREYQQKRHRSPAH